MQWEQNGIEYYYPESVLREIFRDESLTVDALNMDGDRVEHSGVTLTKAELSEDVLNRVTASDELHAELTARFPKISAALPTVRFAVNQEFVVGDLTLKDGDEVAVIPPVSGGEGSERTWVALVNEPIPVARVRAFVTGDPSLGAITT